MIRNETQQNQDPQLIGFLNMVNKIGREVRPDMFDDSRQINCSEPGNFETVNFMMDDSHPPKVYGAKPEGETKEATLIQLGKEEQDKVTMQTVLENVLKDHTNEDEKKISLKFISLFKKLETDVNNIIDKLKTMFNKLLIDLFANKKQINHITGENWRNFGETLLNKPTFIFSDYTKLDDNDKKVKEDTYLIFEGGHFYTVHANNKKTPFDVKHAKYPDTHFSSPITLQHLVAIVELARQTHKVVRAFGSCHSWSPIHTSDGILVDNRQIATIKGKHEIKINKNDPRTKHSTLSKKNELKTTVTTSPGITTGDLEQQLWKLDYSLEASTIEDVFTIGGIGFTSSHGTGKKFTVASDLIVAMTIVCSNGKIVEISPQECVEVDGDKRTPATWLLEKDGKTLSPEDIWRTAQVNLGAFGIIYDMTLIVQPKMNALFVSEAGKWEEYFGTDPSCLEKLSKLNDEWDTLEFWHYPLTVKELDKPTSIDILTGKVTYCPYVTITKTMTDKLSPSQQELYDVVEKKVDSSEFISQLAFQSVGSKFAAKFWKWANKVYQNKITRKLGRLLIKYILVFTGWVGKIRWGKEPVFNKEGKLIKKGEVWSVPQYFANHPVIDATSVVEKIPCLDIEWEVPVPTFQDKSGLKHTVEVYGHLIRNVRERFYNQEYPVSINVEMRFLRGSGSPLSMQYNQQPLFDSEDGGEIVNKGFAAPEIVSMSPNPWWLDFYKKMNHDITTDHKTFGDNIRVHHAKQYASLDGMLKYLRGIYDNPQFSPYDHKDFNTSYKIWREVRTRFDQSKMFLNPHIDQLFYDHKNTYEKPHGYEVSEEGGIVPKKNHTCVMF